jgi:apolipoprotein N-acyltransferase
MTHPDIQVQPTLRLIYGLGLAASAGLLQAFCFPNFLYAGYSPWHSTLAWVSFVPYIYVWRRCRAHGAFGYGWLMGFIYFTGTLTWIRLIGRNTNIDNAIAWLFFAVCGGGYFGLFGLSARWVKERLRWPDALLLPLSFVAWEYLRGHILTGGWPWGSLGATQYASWPIRQLSTVVGVSGLSFLILLGNVWILEGIQAGWRALHRQTTPAPRGSWLEVFRRRPVVASATGLLVLLWISAVAIAVIEGAAFARAPRGEVSLALLQGTLNTRQRWDRAYRTAALDRMQVLHLEAAAGQPDLIIWAESCFPGILEYPPLQEWEDRLRALIREAGVPTVLTSNEYEREQNLDKPMSWHHYNSAFYLGTQGQTLGRYRKLHLVPFGEYIPYGFLKRYLQTVVQQPIPVDFEPGDDFTVLNLGNWGFSVLICYEDMFEELGYQLAKAGADFFLSVANNSWSGQSEMSFQHNAMSVFLAVEHRAYIAKADMTGPTVVIDPWGRIGQALPFFVPAVKRETIHPVKFKTFFTRFGNLIPFVFTIWFFGLCAASFIPRRYLPPAR